MTPVPISGFGANYKPESTAAGSALAGRSKLAAVLFDLDDTLNDRRTSIARFAEVFAADYASCLGEITIAALTEAIRRADRDGYRPKDESMAELLEVLPWRRRPQLDELIDYWQAEFPKISQPMEGLYATLEELHSRKLKLGIITNGDSLAQNAKIDALGIRSYFETVVVSQVVGLVKPDRRIFELALRKLGAEPAETWFVGDHPVNDVIGASSAGMNSIWLRGAIAWPDGHKGPKYKIRALPELVSLLPALA